MYARITSPQRLIFHNVSDGRITETRKKPHHLPGCARKQVASRSLRLAHSGNFVDILKTKRSVISDLLDLQIRSIIMTYQCAGQSSKAMGFAETALGADDSFTRFRRKGVVCVLRLAIKF
jgi:hypothetical protein